MADEEEDSTPDPVKEWLKRDCARTAELAERIGEVTEREALIVQALCDPPDDGSIAVAVPSVDAPDNVHNEWISFRELFPHRLLGADDELLEKLRCVIRLTTEAIEAGDIEALQKVAGTLDPLLGLETKDDRRLTIFSIIEQWITELPDAAKTIPWAASRMPLSTRFRLASAGMPIPSAVEAQMVPEIVENISKPGRSRWGAPKVTEVLMRACGYDDGATEKILRARLDEARKLKDPKKSTAKNS